MRRSTKKNGFSLVEVAFALAIAVFCLVVIIGLFPVGLMSGRASSGEAAANGILNEVAADLRATNLTVPTGQATSSQQFGIAIPAAGATSQTILFFTPQGTSSSTLTPDSRYRLTITFLAGAAGPAASLAVAKVSWPVSAANPVGVVKRFMAFDRN